MTGMAGGFIAFGHDPDAAVYAPRPYGSADGLTWAPTAASSAFAAAAGRQDVVLGANAEGREIVAVGADEAGDQSSASAAVWVSDDDGATWSRGAVPHAADAELHAVAHGPAGWVAVGSDGFGGASAGLAGIRGTAVWTSPDGHAWTRSPASIDSGVAQHVVRDGTGYTASGVALPSSASPAARWHSADGRAWSTLPSPALLEAIESTGASTWVVVGTDAGHRPGIWSSGDGASFAPGLAGAAQPPAGVRMTGVASNGRCWLAVGTDIKSDPIAGMAWASADGRDWQLSETLPGAGIGLLAVSGDRFAVTSAADQSDGSTLRQVQAATC